MSEADHWSMAGANIFAPDLLDRIRDIVKQQPIIVEHRLYRSSSAPIRLIFDEYEDFLNHLRSRAKASTLSPLKDAPTSRDARISPLTATISDVGRCSKISFSLRSERRTTFSMPRCDETGCSPRG